MPWPDGLARRRKFSIYVQARVSFRFVSLRGLELTLIELKSTQVFRRLTTQRKSTQADRKSAVYA